MKGLLVIPLLTTRLPTISLLLFTSFQAGVTEGCNRTIGNLLYTVATKYPANALIHCPALLGCIVTAKIKTPAQLEAAFSFLSSTASESFELKGFEEACGVGVEVSEEDIEQTVNEVFELHKGSILELRYRTNAFMY